MAIREVDVKQIESQQEALSARSDRVVADINAYLATVNQNFDADRGQQLLEDATDTITAINTARETPTALEGRSDPVYTSRVTEAVTNLAVSRDNTSRAREDLRDALNTAGTREPLAEDGTNSAGQIVGNDADSRTELSTVQNPETSPEQGDLAVETPSNVDGVTTRGLAEFDDIETNALAED